MAFGTSFGCMSDAPCPLSPVQIHACHVMCDVCLMYVMSDVCVSWTCRFPALSTRSYIHGKIGKFMNRAALLQLALLRWFGVKWLR